VAGNLIGVPQGTTATVQFEVNNDGNVDGSIESDGTLPFTYAAAGLTPGPVTIDARVQVVDAVLGDLDTSWVPLSFTLETGTDAAPVVTNLALQTETVANSSPPTSADSAITGQVLHDGNVAYMTVDVDTTGSGQADDTTTTDANGNFVYQPQNLAPGTYTFNFRAVEPVYTAGTLTSSATEIDGPWQPFTFTIVAPDPPVVDKLSLANVTGPGTNTTTDPTLTGHVTADGEAANDNIYSAALIADQGQEAVAIAGADQTQELALADAQANDTGQALTNAQADANLAWTQSVAGAEATAANDDATAQQTDVSGDAALEDSFAHSDASEVDGQTKADASSEATQAGDDVTADAARQNADGAAEVTFQQALYNETATQWSSIAGSVNMPWTQYRSGLAGAEAAWYSANSGSYTSFVSQQATAETNYSTQDASNFLTEADNVADDQETSANAVADAAQTAGDAQAGDQFNFVQAMSGAWSNQQIGTAQAQHDYTENGNSVVFNTALASIAANWIGGQSGALGTLETSDANSALVQTTADLNAAENEQEGTSTAELEQIDQYDDAESAAYDAQQKADDVAESVRIQADASSYAAAIQSFAQANPSPWAAEKSALAAADAQQQASLATAQQTESDSEADVEKQAEVSETDAETQFAETQVSDEHDLAVSEATNAAAEVASDVQAMQTQAAQDPDFTALPDALAPPPAPTAPPAGGGRYYSEVTSIDAGNGAFAPAVDADAAGNYGSWLGWSANSSAGGIGAVEVPNLSGSGSTLADAAFAALALLQSDVQVDDPAVRADDTATGADGSKALPAMNSTPPALAPPGTLQPASAPATPPTPTALEAQADAPPAPTGYSAAGSNSGNSGETQPATTPTSSQLQPTNLVVVFVSPASNLTTFSTSPSLLDPTQSFDPQQQSIFTKLAAAQSGPQLYLGPLEQGAASDGSSTSQDSSEAGLSLEKAYEIFLTKYGEEGLALFAWASSRHWDIQIGQYGWVSLRNDWWTDETHPGAKRIYIGATDWGGMSVRSAENAADQMIEALRAQYVKEMSKLDQDQEYANLLGNDYVNRPWYSRWYRLNTAWMVNSWVGSGIKKLDYMATGSTITDQKLSGGQRIWLGTVGSIETLLVAVPGSKLATGLGGKVGLGGLVSAEVADAMAIDLLGGLGERALVRLTESAAGQAFLRAYAKVYNSKYNVTLFGEKQLLGVAAEQAAADGGALLLEDEVAGGTETLSLSKVEAIGRGEQLSAAAELGPTARRIEVVTIQNNMSTRQGSLEILVRGNDPIGSMEINAAQVMQWRGYDVVLRTPVGTRAAGGTSDLFLNGVRAEIYAPTTNSANRVIGAILGKNSQLPGGGVIVLDLRNSTLTAADLSNIAARLSGAAQRSGVELNIVQIEIIE
jgi:hypothetical protein